MAETMYKDTISKNATGNDHAKPKPIGEIAVQISSKVNKICDGFLAVLEQEKYKERHLQNIITAHVCKNPSDLETALEMIGRLQGKATLFHLLMPCEN